jgi:hypothetical protein
MTLLWRKHVLHRRKFYQIEKNLNISDTCNQIYKRTLFNMSDIFDPDLWLASLSG